MPQLRIDYDRYLRRIPTHGHELPPEAEQPIRHYGRLANDAWNLLQYVGRNIARTNVYASRLDAHMERLRVMVLLSLAEAFERFLKECAAACIDQVHPLIPDGRLKVFRVSGDRFAPHFQTSTLGAALCEALPWCDCDEANSRYRSILAMPYEPGDFYVFPKTPKQQPAALRDRYEFVSIIWHLRHAIVHNRGIITASDAQMLQSLCRKPVAGPAVLSPTEADVWYVKLFLDDTANCLNREVATRLAGLLSAVHARNANAFDPGKKAEGLARQFQETVTVAGEPRSP